MLSDLNEELIGFYSVLRDSSDELIARMLSLRASKELYYQLRGSKPRSEIQRAVRFAYLNRLCWNGLFRVNQSGRFNVPIGDRRPQTLWTEEVLQDAARKLQSATLEVADFQKALRAVEPGDAVFLDPPYARGALNGEAFNRYQPQKWSTSDYRRLSDETQRLHEIGAYFVLVVAGQPKLTREFRRKFQVTVHRSQALISCDGESRHEVSEFVVTNCRWRVE